MHGIVPSRTWSQPPKKKQNQQTHKQKTPWYTDNTNKDDSISDKCSETKIINKFMEQDHWQHIQANSNCFLAVLNIIILR